MTEQAPAKVSKKWVEREGWCGLFRKEVEVEVEQIKIDNTVFQTCTAKVTVKVNGKVKLQADVPHCMPAGEIMVPLQMLTMAMEPNSKHQKWQSTFYKFCTLCKGFDPNSVKIFWSKEPLIF